jgi:hypothetical protein
LGSGPNGNAVYDCSGTDNGNNVGWVINSSYACTVPQITNTTNALANMLAVIMVFLIAFGAAITIVVYSFRQADRAAGLNRKKED